MPRDDKDQELAGEGAPTRRGFLFSLLGGLAGAAGLIAIAARSKTASTRSGTTSFPGRNAATPIDNIFVTLRSPNREPRRK